jgi:hypothetical protein
MILSEGPAPEGKGCRTSTIQVLTVSRIIAIMLGPLQMTVAQCLEAYRFIAQRAFTPIDGGFLAWATQLPGPPGGRFSGASLEEAVKDIVEQQTGDRETLFANKTCCKTYDRNFIPRCSLGL